MYFERALLQCSVRLEYFVLQQKQEDSLNAGREQSVTCGNIVPRCALILHLSRPIQGCSTSVSSACFVCTLQSAQEEGLIVVLGKGAPFIPYALL